MSELIKKLEPWLVGMWRFRVKDELPKWCCTYVVDGHYYDTWPYDTLDGALLDVQRMLVGMGEC